MFGASFGGDECTGELKDFSDELTSNSLKSQAVSGSCVDSPLPFKLNKKTFLYCHWVRQDTAERCSMKGISSHCPETCSTCNYCVDSSIVFRVYKTLTCRWVEKKAGVRCKGLGIQDSCRKTCGMC